MNWEDILKEDEYIDDFNEMLDCLRKVRKLSEKYSDRKTFANVERMANNALNALYRIDGEYSDDKR